MAARSSGMFPREGFNLDAECEITTTPTAAATTLAHAKTIRVICVTLAGGDADGLSVSQGGSSGGRGGGA